MFDQRASCSLWRVIIRLTFNFVDILKLANFVWHLCPVPLIQHMDSRIMIPMKASPLQWSEKPSGSWNQMAPVQMLRPSKTPLPWFQPPLCCQPKLRLLFFYFYLITSNPTTKKSSKETPSPPCFYHSDKEKELIACDNAQTFSWSGVRRSDLAHSDLLTVVW